MSNTIPAAPGIYKITCTANKKIYIGSSVNLRDRRAHHFSELRHNRHRNPKLQNAWNKYGEASFVFEVLELILPISPTHREQYWFKKLKPFGRKGFNLARDAQAPALGVKRSPEAIEKVRQANLGRKMPPEEIERRRQSQIGRKMSPEAREKNRQNRLGKKLPPETCAKIGAAHRGRKFSPEHRENLRQTQLGNKKWLGKKHTPETIEKMRQVALGKKKSPEAVEKMRQTKLGKPGPKQSPETIAKRVQTRRQTMLRKREQVSA